jgi:hypothetical protein
MITFDKNSKHLQPLKFVAKAVAKYKGQDGRVHLNNIYCIGPEIIATDGHRCHVYTPEDNPLEAGYYEVIKNTKTELRLVRIECDSEYPEIKRVIPAKDGAVPFEDKSSIYGKFAQVVRAMEQGSINTDYLADALSGEPGMFYKVTDHLSPVLFFGATTLSVVMPLRS